jgi:hypothetical protein
LSRGQQQERSEGATNNKIKYNCCTSKQFNPEEKKKKSKKNNHHKKKESKKLFQTSNKKIFLQSFNKNNSLTTI